MKPRFRKLTLKTARLPAINGEYLLIFGSLAKKWRSIPLRIENGDDCLKPLLSSFLFQTNSRFTRTASPLYKLRNAG